MEQLTTFVSSRGILKSCAVHNKNPLSSHPHIDPDLLEHHRPGGTIYVCTDALRNFSENFLPLIHTPFVLVSGDSDDPISEPLLADPAISAILGNNHLLGWHAQNLSARHPKIFPLAIGLDYHTMWEKPGLWGITAVSPIAQENSLVNTLASSPEFNQRYLTAYCNWHFAIGRGDRQECFEKIDKSVCFFEPTAVPRNSTWLRQAECMFVVSPEGAGMDCHRTWEAILLGCIPIVKKNALSDMFADLPVLIVNDWLEVTKDTLFEYFKTLPERKFDFSPLFRDYWMRKLTSMNMQVMDSMSHTDFRKLLTRKTG